MMVARSPSKPRPPRPAIRAIAALTAAAVGLASFPAQPQTGASAGIPMIRDAEIEQLLRDYTAPIFRVAGLADQNIHVVIIDDKSFNAFVMDAHRIFINVGALMQATTPNQVIGVLAHETGHIVGGHLSKIRQELANVQTAALVGLLLGIGAIVAGARNKQTVVLSARPGRIGRSRRRALSNDDRPIGKRDVRHVQKVCRRVAVLGARDKSLFPEPSYAARAHGGAD